MADLPFPPQTRYDQAARYLLTRTRGNFFHWLLKLTPAQVRLVDWRSTQLTFPGLQQRLCDGVAELIHLADNGRPFVALVEIQTTPDFTMPGRLMLAGALYWLTVKPNDLPGDRFELVGIVLNLTGVGNSARASVIGTAEWILKPIEANFVSLDAGEILDGITTGEIPWELLEFIPLIQRGDQADIIERWRALVLTRLTPSERGDCGLARGFAELVGQQKLWEDAMNEIGFIESPMIGRMLSEAEARGEARGEILGKRGNLLRLLAKRRWAVPAEVTQAIQSCTDAAKLDTWFDAAVDAADLEQFRQNAGL